MFRFSLLLVVILAIAAAYPPDRKPLESPKAKVPDLRGTSNWGEITQGGAEGCKLFLCGDPEWTAAGHVRADGTVYLLWVLTCDGQRAPSVYRFNAETQTWGGSWGWESETELDAEGELTGNIEDDEIFWPDRLPPPVEGPEPEFAR